MKLLIWSSWHCHDTPGFLPTCILFLGPCAIWESNDTEKSQHRFWKVWAGWKFCLMFSMCRWRKDRKGIWLLCLGKPVIRDETSTAVRSHGPVLHLLVGFPLGFVMKRHSRSCPSRKPWLSRQQRSTLRSPPLRTKVVLLLPGHSFFKGFKGHCMVLNDHLQLFKRLLSLEKIRCAMNHFAMSGFFCNFFWPGKWYL